MPSLRLQRVRELLKREIGEVIRREFPVSEAGLVTVNDVDVSGDRIRRPSSSASWARLSSRSGAWIC